MKTRFLCLLILVCSLKVSAAAQDTPVDDSILTQQECTFPCWQGLVPGQTGIEAARDVLQIIPFGFMSNDRISEGQTAEAVSRYYISWIHGLNGGGSLAFENEILRSILIYPNIAFNLQDILTRYGTPDAWTSQQEHGAEVTSTYLRTYLYYLDYGLIVEFKMYEGGPVTDFYIQPEAQGLRFWLVSASSSIEQMLMDQLGISSERAATRAKGDFQYTWPDLFAKITLPSTFSLAGFHDVATIVPPSAATLTAIPSITLTPIPTT